MRDGGELDRGDARAPTARSIQVAARITDVASDITGIDRGSSRIEVAFW
jgi:hypothetical protein